nr:T9SS type A sorting domain-containing protein [Bacteroidota bacterium]
ELASGAGLSAQNFPNPTNGATRLVYDLIGSAPVTIELFDVSGKVVMSFNEGNKAPGQHQLNFNVTGLEAGVYFHVLRAGDSEVTGRMVVVK